MDRGSTLLPYKDYCLYQMFSDKTNEGHTWTEEVQLLPYKDYCLYQMFSDKTKEGHTWTEEVHYYLIRTIASIRCSQTRPTRDKHGQRKYTTTL